MTDRPLRLMALAAILLFPICLVSLVFLAAPRTAFAEDAPAGDKKADVQMDEASKKLFDAWENMHHHAGKAGAKKASVRWEASVESMMGAMKGKATYVWDGKKGHTKWDNEMVGQMLSQEGWGQDVLDGNFESDSMLKTMKGLKLTATPGENGTAVKAEGKSEAGYSSFQFDKDGLLTTMVMENNEPPMGPMTITLTFRYTKVGEKYLMSGWDVKVPVPGMGEYTGTATITWQKVGDYHVYAKAEVKGTMGGQPAGSKSLTWSDWKFNDDVTAGDGCGCGEGCGCDEGCGESGGCGCDEGCGE